MSETLSIIRLSGMPTLECSEYQTVECTEYQTYKETDSLCRCPSCKGWLPRDFPLDKTFKCKKCRTELMAFPDIDLESGDDNEWGKICPISKPERDLKNVL